MIVLHVEDHPYWRDALARNVGVKNGQVSGYGYIATDLVAEAERKLREEDLQVQVLILDLRLNPKLENKTMERVLRSWARDPEALDPQTAQQFAAYRLAEQANARGVRCVLFTNFADELNVEKDLTAERLCEAFGAAAIFRKDEAGIQECATWVRQELGLNPMPFPKS
jgi:hypothetical protein